jgi:hypothetical protein
MHYLSLNGDWCFCPVQTIAMTSDISRLDAAAVLGGCVERSLRIMCQKFLMLFLISSKASLLNYFLRSVGQIWGKASSVFSQPFLLTPKQQPIFINGTKVPYANTAKYLGMTFDAKLRWKEHIKKKTLWAQHQVQETVLVAWTQFWAVSPQ